MTVLSNKKQRGKIMPNHLLKRISVVFIAFLLIIGNFTAASAFENTLASKKQLQEKPVLETNKLSETDDPDKEVRVIVEMEDEAPIQAATFKGKKYVDLDKAKKENLEKAAKAKQQSVKDSMQKEKVSAKHLRSEERRVGKEGR